MSLAIISSTEGNGRKRLQAGIPRKMIRLDRVGQGLPGKVVVLIGPGEIIVDAGHERLQSAVLSECDG
jgi:hypothetical protein